MGGGPIGALLSVCAAVESYFDGSRVCDGVCLATDER